MNYQPETHRTEDIIEHLKHFKVQINDGIVDFKSFTIIQEDVKVETGLTFDLDSNQILAIKLIANDPSKGSPASRMILDRINERVTHLSKMIRYNDIEDFKRFLVSADVINKFKL